MWDENKVLELLKDMPQILSDENLCEIQKIIDDDRYWDNRNFKKDLCDNYAPFCKICDKTVLTPCAVAYVRTKIKGGAPLRMENIASETEETEAAASLSEKTEGDGNHEFDFDNESEDAKNKKIHIGIGYRKYRY